MEIEVCKMINCWYNSEEGCTSVGDLRNNELGVDCPEYIPDED